MSATLVQNSGSSTPVRPRRPAGSRGLVVLALLALLASSIFRTATNINDRASNYRAREGGIHSITGGDWFAGMLLGFREMVADLMWIQVDAYFHEGRYDKILPVCYVITALNPGWIDVYSTGAWHLGYNFGDRRLVPAAIAFDQRGVNNNPLNYDIWYELGWMQSSRGYDFVDAARNMKRANDLGLLPTGKRHAWPHALESAGDVDGALRAWELLAKQFPSDPIPKKWIFLLNLRKTARKDLGTRPIQVHMDVKITRKGPLVLHVDGVTNLPKYSRVFFDLKDEDWKSREKKPLAWQVAHYTLYSQTDTTLLPQWGMFDAQGIDFDRGTLKIHKGLLAGEPTPEELAKEPPMPVRNGHMIMADGRFAGDIDMSKTPDQYPLESKRYIFTLYVNPRLEPITTQDVIGWNGEGMTGPLVHKVDGYNELRWSCILKKSDID